MTKTCTRCLQTKPVTDFYESKGRCKTCLRELAKAQTQAMTPEQRAARCRRQVEYQRTPAGLAAARRAKLKHFYDITVEEYDEMLARQDGCCLLCRTDKPGPRVKNFAVDHDHVTGKVRGLLCVQCNYKLGWFEGIGPDRVLAYLDAAIR